mgnify:CR=1 FL=1
MTPEEHDRVYANISHLPQLVSTALMQHCRENLTGYKRPKTIEFRAELPKTNVGKILRRELRKLL